MFLTEKEIERNKKNAKKYFDTGAKYEFMTDELIGFIGEGIIGAPASELLSKHNAFEGGLIDHILRVTSYAVSLNKLLPESMRVPMQSLIKVCCLHQIGKAYQFITCTSDWHRTNQGKMYEFNEELVSMRVGERSALYAMTNGVTLSDVEYQAIVNYDKDDTDKQSKWYTDTLGVLLRNSNEMAMLEEKNDGKSK